MGEVLWIIGVVVLLLVIGGVLALWGWPVYRRNVRADQDYLAARGTQHKQHLLDSRARLQQQMDGIRQRESILSGDLAQIDAEEAGQLDRALTEHLVATELGQVPGIGAGRRRQLQDQVFRGRLSDLHTAHELPGIGPATQEAISAWIRSVESSWTERRQRSFPGKAEIAAHFAARRAQMQQEAQALVTERQGLEQLIQVIDLQVAPLVAVTRNDFRAALRQTPTQGAQMALDRYLVGLFAPWEGIPDWWTEVTEAAYGRQASPSPHPTTTTRESADVAEDAHAILA